MLASVMPTKEGQPPSSALTYYNMPPCLLGLLLYPYITYALKHFDISCLPPTPAFHACPSYPKTPSLLHDGTGEDDFDPEPDRWAGLPFFHGQWGELPYLPYAWASRAFCLSPCFILHFSACYFLPSHSKPNLEAGWAVGRWWWDLMVVMRVCVPVEPCATILYSTTSPSHHHLIVRGRRRGGDLVTAHLTTITCINNSLMPLTITVNSFFLDSLNGHIVMTCLIF